MHTDASARMDCAALIERGFFEPIDYHFARFLAHKSACPDDAVLLAAALASRATRMGHVCLDLNAAAGSCPDDGAAALAQLSPEQWRARLLEAGCVGVPGETKPLILDGCSRLYLYRMFSREQHLAAYILARAARTTMPADAELLAHSFVRFFPPEADARLRLAGFSAAVKPLCVICGGPGTGKTTTAARILALLLEQPGQGRRIALAAPTGKAADRLQKAVAGAAAALDAAPELTSAIAREAMTLHRLLGIQPGRPAGRYAQGPRLPADIVVVDEASMVDLSLMACLFEALTDDARVILLGDHNQLASVAPGAVLGDLFRAGSCGRYSAEFLAGFAATGQSLPEGIPEQGTAAVLDDCLNELTANYRFSSTSGIARVSRAVAAGKTAAALELLEHGHADISLHALPGPAGLAAALSDSVLVGFGDYLACDDPLEVIARFERFRILCALREGPYGVYSLNALAESLLERTGTWYHGRPVLVTRNHYPLRLFNGDIGIALKLEGEPLRVFFATHDGGLRAFGPEQLPDHETAYATTVHKAQGAEYESAILLLPDRASPVLARELVYTGLTRVRTRIDVWAESAVLRAAINSKIERSSGLFDALR